MSVDPLRTDRPVRIAIVAGDPSAGACGITDYSLRLVDSLRRAGIDVEFVAWNSGYRAVVRSLEAHSPELVHLQYPARSYRLSLLPHLLTVRRAPVLTIHEALSAHPLRRLSLIPAAYRAKHLVFTTEAERSYMVKYLGSSPKSTVIPIGSNIPTLDRSRAPAPQVVFFGILTPEKGLNDFIHLAQLAVEEDVGVSFVIMGEVEPRHKKYVNSLQQMTTDLPVEWRFSIDSHDVSRVLSCSLAAYLPYPDGVSDRRGSSLAALSNGLPTITTTGIWTTPELSGTVMAADNPMQALRHLTSLLKDPQLHRDTSRRSWDYASSRSWETISAAHVSLYSDLIRQHQ